MGTCGSCRRGSKNGSTAVLDSIGNDSTKADSSGKGAKDNQAYDKTEDRTELNKTEIENLKSSTENGKINKSLELDSDDEANKSSEEEKEENDADDNQQSDKSEAKSEEEEEMIEEKKEGESDKEEENKEMEDDSGKESGEEHEDGTDKESGNGSGDEQENESEHEEEEVNSNESDASDDDEDDDDESERRARRDSGIVSDIIMGNVEIELPSQVRLVRIFTSSTFTDTFVERNTLMEKVYPKLKEYCQSIGYDFQVVDMRWGVRDEATDDHMTSELCMRELKACQQLSTGPNFITFLGQKYGYRPFPPKILASEFESMVSVIENEEDIACLDKWFKRDDNLVPPMYILQSIRSLLPDYNNPSSSSEERSKASGEWWGAFERMQVVLREAAKKVFKDDAEVMKYYISVTEDEIRRGIINARDIKHHCYWFKRNITNIKDNIDKKKARFFIDKCGNGVDAEAVDLLDNLKENKMLKALPKDNICEYDVEWAGEDGVSPDDSETHKTYISKLCKDFYDTLVRMVDEGVRERKRKDLEDALVKEISLHTSTCQDKSKVFYGREEVLKKIHEYVKDETTSPLVVHGPSGCGKTSIMAVAAKKIKELYPDKGLILRFLGTTSDSSTISKTLYSVCVQLCHMNGDRVDSIPQTFKELLEFCEEQFQKMNESVVIILDSLDQLAPEDGAYMVKWLPKQLPDKIKFVVSTLPGEEYKVMPNLKLRLPPTSFTEVPILPVETASLILDAWLKDAGHVVTDAQKKVVMDAFDQCPLPLFLKLANDEALRWKSYTPPEQTILQHTIKAAINGLFERLERLHGHLLVSHALGYMTAAKSGLSDAELDDILSIDDEVLNDVYQYWTPPVRRIPPLLWVRAKNDLGSYLTSRGADNVLVNTWYHRQFIETATERYLPPDAAKKLHRTLADYFLGTWSGGYKKPFTDKQGHDAEKDRLVPAQPDIFSSKDDGEGDVFNYRKLSELPRHLIQCGELQILKEEALLNFNFMLSKIRATGLRNLLQDYNEALRVFTGETELKLVLSFLKMASKSIYSDPYQLAAQLHARMSDYHNFPGVSKLLDDAQSANIPCLYPSITCFEKPGGSLVHSLAGHIAMVTWAVVSKDGKRLVSVSNDNTLKIWDMVSGELIRSIDLGNSYNVVVLYHNDTCAAMGTYAGFLAIELESEEELYKDEMLIGQHGTCLASAADGKRVAMFGMEKVTIFDTENKIPTITRTIEDKGEIAQSGYQDSVHGGGKFIAYTRGDQKKIKIIDVFDDSFKKTVKVPVNLVHFTLNPSGTELIALGSDSPMTEPYKEVNLMIWETRNWDLVKDVKSKFDHMIVMVSSMTIIETKQGSVLVWPVLFQINFWNLETSKERVALKSGYQGNQFKQCHSSDGKLLAVVSPDYNQRAIQIYDLDLLEYIEGGDKHLSQLEKTKAYVGQGEREAFLNPDDPSVILSVPPADAIITFWDAKHHYRIRTVRFDKIFPTGIYPIGDSHLAIWEHGQKKIYLVNITEGKIEAGTEGRKISETPPSSATIQTWAYLGDFVMAAQSENAKSLNIWDLKTGKLLDTLKTGVSQKIHTMRLSTDKSTLLCAIQDYEAKLKKLPLICFDMKSKKIISKIEIEELRPDLRPEVTGLTDDGSLLFILDSNMMAIIVIETKSGKMLRKLEYNPKKAKNEMFVQASSIMALAFTQKGGFLLACTCTSVQLKKGRSGMVEYRTVAYDIDNWEMTGFLKGGYFQKMMFSEDGQRLATKSNAFQEQVQAIELWDTSRVKSEGKFALIGRFVPETDARFCYTTFDASSLFIGIANIADIVFLQPCGSEKTEKKSDECMEVKIPAPEGWVMPKQ